MGLTQVPVDEAGAGDIVGIAGFLDILLVKPLLTLIPKLFLLLRLMNQLFLWNSLLIIVLSLAWMAIM